MGAVQGTCKAVVTANAETSSRKTPAKGPFGRREFLARSLAAAAGATLTSAPAVAALAPSGRQTESATAGYAAALLRNREPPLVHYRMPYQAVSLQSGPALTRAYDEAALLAALQGIVNRDAPRLYILGVSGGGIADLDSFWWQRMGELGWSVARQQPYEAQSLSELLQLFKHRARGLVVWDPSVPATANVAATLAGPGTRLLRSPCGPVFRHPHHILVPSRSWTCPRCWPCLGPTRRARHSRVRSRPARRDSWMPVRGEAGSFSAGTLP